MDFSSENFFLEVESTLDYNKNREIEKNEYEILHYNDNNTYIKNNIFWNK